MLACAASGLLEGDLRHAPHVESDRRKGPPETDTPNESLVECTLECERRGLTTSRIPYGERSFEVWFDFMRHQLVLETSDGVVKTMQLAPRTVADFYRIS
jgi:hypothetical protein